jgi:hypothetical protein
MNTSAGLRLFALLAGLAAPLAAQTGPELLAKYNFESLPVYVPDWGAGHGSTYKPATGWKTPFRVSLDSANPHAGDNALRFELLESSEKEKIVHGPAIKIAAPADGAVGERRLLVRLFVRSSGITGKGAGIRLLERDEKNASIRLLGNKTSLIPVPDSADWVELEAEGALHSRTRSVTFMVVAYQSETPATVWIDDVSIELAPAVR